ncbi:MAG: EAL domain-containing protein, partial [Candidatus Dormibacteria bacterium]
LIPELVERKDLDSVYQPICRLDDRSVMGYEALARPAGQAADTSVEALFTAAQRMGALRDLDWLSRRAALGGAADLPDQVLLFVNVGARAFLDPLHDVDQMLLLTQWAGRSPHDIVLEISEREVVSDLRRLREVIGSYRREGFRFAMDDVGEGHLTLELLGAANPEFVKVARSLTVDAALGEQRAVIRALVEFSLSAGAMVIAEGIEDRSQLETMRELGVQLGQGYYLGRPAALAPAQGRRTARERS